jgi:hypothetical protein
VCGTYPIKDGETKVITSMLVGTQASGIGTPDSYFEVRRIVVRRNDGTVQVVKADAQLDVQTNATGTAWSSNLAIVGQTVVHRVTGDTAKTIKWSTKGEAFGQGTV